MMLSKIKNKSNKIVKKIRPNKEELPVRITNETIDLHRENIISSGRKFKYPIQYAKHKLVYNALIILISVAIIFSSIVWWQLYQAQTSNDFFYRIARIFPLPVAMIDGELVPYKDYLMKFNSSIHYFENIEKINLQNNETSSPLDYYKKISMKEALMNAYARKIIKQKKLSIDINDIDTLLKQQRISSTGQVSQQTYNAVILEYYNWTEEEYRYALENTIIRQTAAYSLDEEALAIANKVSETINSGNSDLSLIAKNFNQSSDRKIEFVDSGSVSKNNSDRGILTEASLLEKNKISKIYKPVAGDGYYLIKLIDINDTKIQYQYIKISIKSLEDKVSELQKANKVKYYIKMP